MGLPARKNDRYTRRPVLRLLHGGRRSPARATRRSRSSAAQTARYRRLFQLTAVALIAVMGLGMARVQVTVQATEATLAANALKEAIDREQIRAEALEADRIALATPSRIESIAEASMGMGVAAEVDYLEFSGTAEDAEEHEGFSHASARQSAVSERVAAVLADVMRMTAGEAQVLLVGDAGLASSR
jgi:cell division protein FtsL